jgi:hypothetical protein
MILKTIGLKEGMIVLHIYLLFSIWGKIDGMIFIVHSMYPILLFQERQQYSRKWNPLIRKFGKLLVSIGFLAETLLSTSAWRDSQVRN